MIYQEETQQYALSPLFDQGLCLLADVKMDYPLEPLWKHVRRI
ncbi:MAG: hypothetical protein ACLR2E_23250 [Lachnospiraceae bacterium]